jgi:hypothetical protein
MCAYDGFFELEELFARRFNVDMPAYRWSLSQPYCFWKVRMREGGYWNTLRTSYQPCVTTGWPIWAFGPAVQSQLAKRQERRSWLRWI